MMNPYPSRLLKNFTVPVLSSPSSSSSSAAAAEVSEDGESEKDLRLDV